MAAQENKTPDPANEQRKKILAGVLMLVLVCVLLWQFGFFTSGVETSATSTVTAQARTSPTPKGSPTPTRGIPLVEQLVTDHLRPEFAYNKATPLDGIGRNIFVYPPPTPPPTPKPLPPAPPAPTPPIILVGIQPSGVIGRTGDQTLMVTGVKFPDDARIFLDGREIKTTLQDESHLTGAVTADMIRNAGNLGIQVRSASNAQLYSNQIALNVAEPPAPPYRFVALFVGKQSMVAVLKSQSDEDVINVKKGDIVDKKTKRWEVKSISAQRIELLDTQIMVTHFINFTAEGGS